jgi:cyanate permease
MIIDVTFIHQRPNAIAIFWSVGSVVELVCLSVVPEISKAGGSWRTSYIVWTIPAGIALLAFLFCPEPTSSVPLLHLMDTSSYRVP